MRSHIVRSLVIILKIINFFEIYGFAHSLTSSIVQFRSGGKIITIEGAEENDWNDEKYFSFRGIPYAKPPVGVLRFKDPQPFKSLPQYIVARYDGHDCESILSTNASEDCLILNIYTKNPKPLRPLPVIVFIHFGGLYLTSSLSSLIGPQILLTKETVLVTFNYRLGTLGFLNLGTKDIPGNAGFKDQVHALRWVQKYIQYFGGNKSDITLMGYSAGGLSVSLHLVSLMSKGLFHKAIIMSGVVPPQTILPRGNQIELSIRQCRALNCTIEDRPTSDEILHCLNGFSGTKIAATLRSLFVFGKDHPLYLWRPVIENDFGQERFLTEDFYSLIKRGEFQKVPILIGFNNGEFCTAAVEILENDQLERRFHEEFHILLPSILMFEEQTNGIEKSEAISEFYTGIKYQRNWKLYPLCDMISDGLIRFGSHRLASIVSQFSSVYAYNFVYRGAYSNLNFENSTARVEHMDDLMYLFQMPSHSFKDNENDTKIVKLYVDFVWVFIQHGKINESLLTFPQSHIVINETLEQKRGSNFANATFWERLFL